MRRSVRVIRRDHKPWYSCFSGSGLPIPRNGSARVSPIIRRSRSRTPRLCSFHQSRSVTNSSDSSAFRGGSGRAAGSFFLRFPRTAESRVELVKRELVRTAGERVLDRAVETGRVLRIAEEGLGVITAPQPPQAELARSGRRSPP